MEVNVLLQNAEAEAIALRKQLEEGNKRLAELEQLVNLVKKFSVSTVAGTILPSRAVVMTGIAPPMVITNYPSQIQAGNSAASGHGVITKKEAILTNSAAILGDGVARFSRQLLAELSDRGVQVGGKDPILNLSSYLSREKDIFVSDQRAGGWSLRRLPKKVRPDEAPTSSGLGVNGLEGHPARGLRE
jgi:hypothetical protein